MEIGDEKLSLVVIKIVWPKKCFLVSQQIHTVTEVTPPDKLLVYLGEEN